MGLDRPEWRYSPMVCEVCGETLAEGGQRVRLSLLGEHRETCVEYIRLERDAARAQLRQLERRPLRRLSRRIGSVIDFLDNECLSTEGRYSWLGFPIGLLMLAAFWAVFLTLAALFD